MRGVICPDSFKGSLDAPAACEAIRRGLLARHPGLELHCLPLADGGEGTAHALLAARPGSWVPHRVTGPLPDTPVEAGTAWWPDESTALVEMASASGLTLLPPNARDPLCTTTLGTGELVRAALDAGARRLLLAVGGSATLDGGVGLAAALGWELLDGSGQRVPPVGGRLIDIARLVEPPPRRLPPVQVLCDVDHPLCGERGAARVFGPQKGADPDAVCALERGLEHLADLWRVALGRDLADVPGGGAAGGLAAGAMAFLGAELVPGIDAVMDWVGLDTQLAGADFVVTGEGCFDAQSLRGKVVSGVLRRAAAHRVPVIVLAGRVETEAPPGVAQVRAITPPGTTEAEAMARAAEFLEAAAARVAF